MEKGKTPCEIIGSATRVAVREAVISYKKVVECLKNWYSTISKICSDCIDLTPSSIEIEEASSNPGQASDSARKRVTFKYKNMQAKKVELAASFASWQRRAMTKKEDGSWDTAVDLAPGKYLYKFVVDESWIKDPANPKAQPDGYGGESSVLEL